MRRVLVAVVLFACGCSSLLGVDFDSAFPEPTDGGSSPVAADGAACSPGAPGCSGSDGSGGSSGSSDSGGSSGSSGSGSSSGSSGGAPDGSIEASVCAETPCKASLPQCGCAAGQACIVTSSGPKCGAPGVVDEADECATNAECTPGHVCARGQDGAPTKVCKRLCASDGDCVGPGSICLPDTGFNACSIGCDPVHSTRCPPTTGCQLFKRSGDQKPFTDCGPIGTREPLQSCNETIRCQAGYTCGTNGGTDACMAYCTPADCSCQVTATFGGTSYGVCH